MPIQWQPHEATLRGWRPIYRGQLISHQMRKLLQWKGACLRLAWTIWLIRWNGGWRTTADSEQTWDQQGEVSWKSAGDSPNRSERPGGDVLREQRVKVGSRATGSKVGSQVRCFSLSKTEPLKTEQSVQMLSPHSGTSATGVFLFSNHFSLHILSPFNGRLSWVPESH